MFASVVSISAGAALGALLRWWLATRLNVLWWPQLPLGTWIANLLGGYLIGLAMAVFMQWPGLPPQWRLFIVTGFLGGLTTFSTFSAEVAAHLLEWRWSWASVVVLAHVVGSVVMTLLGVATVAGLKQLR